MWKFLLNYDIIMKKLILGGVFMTRHELHEILKIPFWKRHSQGMQTLEWEHCAKAFYKITNDLALEHLMKIYDDISKEDDDPMILKCESDCGTYYFGVGLTDCDAITLKELRELYNRATWYVYTWSD